MQDGSQPDAPVIATDNEIRDMRERRIVNGVRRACGRQESDLADQPALGVGYEAAHIRVGQRLAHMLQLGLKRWRGPARRRERRVILDAVYDAVGQLLGVGAGCPANADRVITRHVTAVSRSTPPRGSGTYALLRSQRAALGATAHSVGLARQR